MTAALILLIALVTMTSIWLLLSLNKLKGRNQLIIFQGKEIEKQLQEMEQHSKELNELIFQNKQIIGIVSHDLKGPFNRIFALVHLMNHSADNLTNNQKEYLDKIHQIVVDGLGMMRNLLDNRRLEEKGIDLNNDKVNLITLLGSLVKNYQVLAEKKGISVYFESPKQVFLVSDKLYLTRVFENLLSNAVKFSDPNMDVFVSVIEEEKMISVSVRDEGPGISQADQQNLYHKLQRLSARPTGGESSTGLGLWIVKSIVDKMEGEIMCSSDQGKGATFKVLLKK